jgi:hypothetical protein
MVADERIVSLVEAPLEVGRARNANSPAARNARPSGWRSDLDLASNHLAVHREVDSECLA